ncbi:MAG: PTS sugar transporter subunit IIB [Streptococcaceae bacterium]|nr:PTS sugar transporter subunit IIB [Streptococcaceae bacterium]
MSKKVIALACSAGMSTSLLVKKMQDAAAVEGLNYEIYAEAAAEIDNILSGTGHSKPDVLLLGPQVSYMKAEVSKKTEAAGIPLDIINMQDYGMMNGGKVLASAMALMEYNHE